MRKLLFFAGLLFLLSVTRCDLNNTQPFPEPSWVGDWSGEMYNDLDLENVNGPQGRTDSLRVVFTYDGNVGFDANGTWRLSRPLFEDEDAKVDGSVSRYSYNPERDWEEFQFDVLVGPEGTTPIAYNFLCWTNDENAAHGVLTCFRLRSTIDKVNPDVTPPQFVPFQLFPNAFKN